MTLFPVTLILTLALTESFAADLRHSQRSLSRVSASLPITSKTRSSLRKRQDPQSVAVGLGDARDKDYSVQAVLGDTAVSLILDTGSSDLWAINSLCMRNASDCGNPSTSTPQIPYDSFNFTGHFVAFQYGDSTHRTRAEGRIVFGNVSVAGLQLNDQPFCSTEDTHALSDDGSSGVFGLGFPNPIAGLDIDLASSPAGSLIFQALLLDNLPFSEFGPTHLADLFISKLPSQGPFLSRLVANGQLKQPMFTVTLQREDIEVGGNVGQLTIGQLPDGVHEESLTWVEVVLYTQDQGSMSGPTSNPKELYPVYWEIPIDDVVLNGQTLPKPDLHGGRHTALINSRYSSLAGPKDVVRTIYNSTALSGPSGSSDPPLISCTKPVDLAFVIGGKNFPVDPRDFLSQQTDTDNCNAGSVLATDGAFQEAGEISWILGDPFLKSNLVAFYYGNLTHPSADPPRIGFLSTVPSNAADLLAADVKSADNAGGFVASSVSAPTTMFVPTSTNPVGVGQAPPGAATTVGRSGQKNGALPIGVPLAVLAVVTSLCGFLT